MAMEPYDTREVKMAFPYSLSAYLLRNILDVKTVRLNHIHWYLLGEMQQRMSNMNIISEGKPVVIILKSWENNETEKTRLNFVIHWSQELSRALPMNENNARFRAIPYCIWHVYIWLGNTIWSLWLPNHHNIAL